VGALEIAARLRGLAPIASYLGPAAETCLARDPALNLVFRPACHGALSFTDFRTNSLGLRGAEPHTDARVRVLALGDSCTWGWGVRDEETFPAVLGSLAGEDADVVNAGVPGYTSRQGLRYLRERGLALRPDVVFIGFGFNDARPAATVEAAVARTGRVSALIRAEDLLAAHSAFYRWTRGKLEAVAVRDKAPQTTPGEYAGNLRALVDTVRAAGAYPILLGFWPSDERLGYRPALLAVAAAAAVPLVEYEGPRLDVVHPTAEGYRALAERLYGMLPKLVPR
jgi:lysophospholipase L1-like esterase